MSRGHGKIQRFILDELERRGEWCYLSDLAWKYGDDEKPSRSIEASFRRAVSALAKADRIKKAYGASRPPDVKWSVIVGIDGEPAGHWIHSWRHPESRSRCRAAERAVLVCIDYVLNRNASGDGYCSYKDVHREAARLNVKDYTFTRAVERLEQSGQVQTIARKWQPYPQEPSVRRQRRILIKRCSAGSISEIRQTRLDDV